MQFIASWISSLLGLGVEPSKLGILQVSLRGVIVFIFALALVRLSDRRSLTKKSPFAVVLLVVIASVLARTINGSGPFVPTLVGVAVIVFMHRLVAAMICRWPLFSKLVKGDSVVLVREGNIQRKALRRESISTDDILEDLRLTAKKDDLEEIKYARLEVSGDVSFIMKESSD